MIESTSSGMMASQCKLVLRGTAGVNQVQTDGATGFSNSIPLEWTTSREAGVTMTGLVEKADCKVERLKSSRCDTGQPRESHLAG